MRTRLIVTGLAVVVLAALAALLLFARQTDALGPCDGDSFEPNNPPFSPPFPISLPFEESDLRICAADQFDFYSFPLSQGFQVQVDATFPEGVFRVQLEDSSLQVVAVSSSEGNTEKISYTAATSGTYTVVVEHLALCFPAVACIDKQGFGYDLEIAVLCKDDAFEQNDTVATASSILPPFDQDGLRACPNDFDAYSFPLATGGDVQIDALFFGGGGNIDVALFNPSGSVVAVANSFTDNEKISYHAIQGGTYTARVQLTGSSPPDGAPYRLQVTKSCSDDSFEENDLAGGASPVSLPFNFAGLRACPADDDYYSFPLTTGQQIQVSAIFFHAVDGDIDLSLRDPNGVAVSASASTSDNEMITFTATKDGTHTVVVNLDGIPRAEGNGYWLQISAAATPLACLDDAFEENDTRQTAAAVSLPFSQPGLAVCFEPEDEDWFSFPLSTGVAVQVDASFIHAEGNINIRLFRDGTPVAQSISLDDNEKIAFTATADGTYTLQVEPLPDPFSDPGNTYALEISATCVSDAFEPNDALETAAPASLPFSEAALTVCPEEHDYYSFPLTAGGTVQTDASFSTAEGNINIRLFDPDGAVVAQSITSTDDEKIAYTAATTGTHTLQVELLPDPFTAPGNSYRLEVSATEPPTPTITPTPTVTATAPLVAPTATATTAAPTATPTSTTTATATAPFVAPTATSTTAATPALEKALGDVNSDGAVNAIDAALILQQDAGLLAEVPNPASADLNGDEAINSIDAALILQFVAGLLGTLPP